jgi:hypothetical protein
MSKISKVERNNGLTKADDDGVVECVSIRGTVIDLRRVSPNLRDRYRAASKRVGYHEDARDELNRVGEAILAEQAIKVAPRFSGTDAAEKLLGIGLKN